MWIEAAEAAGEAKTQEKILPGVARQHVVLDAAAQANAA
jgi:hypothetical protein